MVSLKCTVYQQNLCHVCRDFDAVNEITEELEPHFRDLVTDR